MTVLFEILSFIGGVTLVVIVAGLANGIGETEITERRVDGKIKGENENGEN